MQAQSGWLEQAYRTPDAKTSLAKISSSGKKPVKRKGGLSMFLAGKAHFCATELHKLLKDSRHLVDLY